MRRTSMRLCVNFRNLTARRECQGAEGTPSFTQLVKGSGRPVADPGLAILRRAWLMRRA